MQNYVYTSSTVDYSYHKLNSMINKIAVKSTAIWSAVFSIMGNRSDIK